MNLLIYTQIPLQNFEHMGFGHVICDVNSNMAASSVATAAAVGDLQVLVLNILAWKIRLSVLNNKNYRLMLINCVF